MYDQVHSVSVLVSGKIAWLLSVDIGEFRGSEEWGFLGTGGEEGDGDADEYE